MPRLGVAFVLGGLAGTMAPISFVLFARDATGSFSTASLVLAAVIAGGVVMAPVRGRLVDRIGPSRAVLLLAGPSAATDVALIVAGRSGVPAGALVAIAFVAGASIPPIDVALRTTFSEMLDEVGLRQPGYALLTLLQEVRFIAGPLLAGGLVAVASPTAAVGTAAALAAFGPLLFATSAPARRVTPKPAAAARWGALSSAGMRTVIVVAGFFGVIFGALDVAIPAFAREHGSAAAAGVVLAAISVGILLGTTLYGARNPAAPPVRQYPWLCAIAAASLVPIIAPGSNLGLAAAGLVLGMGFAPITTCQIAVIDDVAPEGRKAEGLAWLGTLYGAGLSAGAALAGQIVAGASARAAFAVAIGAAAIAGLVAFARAGTLVQPHAARE